MGSVKETEVWVKDAHTDKTGRSQNNSIHKKHNKEAEKMRMTWCED